MDISRDDTRVLIETDEGRGAALRRWLSAHGVVWPVAAELIAGGHSNLTYLLADASGARYVFRRPPLALGLAGAHDVDRERRIVEALGGSAVPVPEVVGAVADDTVIGAPFYLMRYVDGQVWRTPTEASALTPSDRANASQSLADVLADLHAVDPSEVGLGRLGRPTGYVDRQLRRWRAQFEVQHTGPISEVDRVYRRLVESIPPQECASIVHGDFRLDNCIVAPDGTVRAVLDWELCTLGDPLADLATLLVYWTGPDDVPSAWQDSATTAVGFWNRAAIVEAYAARSGADLSSIQFHLAFASWRLACVLAGVQARRAGGALGNSDARLAAHIGEQASAAARQAERLLDGDDPVVCCTDTSAAAQLSQNNNNSILSRLFE